MRVEPFQGGIPTASLFSSMSWSMISNAALYVCWNMLIQLFPIINVLLPKLALECMLRRVNNCMDIWLKDHVCRNGV